jgi:hypothetical protein
VWPEWTVRQHTFLLGALVCRFSDINHFVVEGPEVGVMHAKENKIDDISHMQHWLKLKKLINHKPNIKIKF